jgi:hypothetical protein
MNYRRAFEAVISDPRYLANIDWGKPRSGHPEGTVRAHIADLEANLVSLSPRLTEEESWKLKLLIHTHDSFKAEAQSGVPIEDHRSHASLAREFLATHCSDPDLLAMVQYHDEPYALYRQFVSNGGYDPERFVKLLAAIRDWDLFLAFNIIDRGTTGKSPGPLLWFFNELRGKVRSRFTSADVMSA